MYDQTNEFVYLGGDVNHSSDLSIEVDRRIRNVWCSFRKYTHGLHDRTSAPLELKTRMLKAEVLDTMLYGCVSWSPRACHYDTLWRGGLVHFARNKQALRNIPYTVYHEAKSVRGHPDAINRDESRE
ncbi:unnamed protein product [Ascophyllum nodosum]